MKAKPFRVRTEEPENKNAAGRSRTAFLIASEAWDQAAWPVSHLLSPAFGVPAPIFMSTASPFL